MLIREEIMQIDKTTEMMFRNEEAKKVWDEITEKTSQSFYQDTAITDFARRWAKYMQTLINKGKSVAQITEYTSNESDFEGITGHMYSCAINDLFKCWKYGDELRQWHNQKVGYVGEGVADSATLACRR